MTALRIDVAGISIAIDAEVLRPLIEVFVRETLEQVGPTPQCQSATETQPLLISKREAAQVLGLCERTLDARRDEIPAVKIGSRVMYSTATLQRWIAEKESD